MCVGRSTSALRFARRPRAFVRVAGPEAAQYLERMVSNAVADLPLGSARDALLLTPKARVIAPLRVLRRSEDDFLLLTEPELGEVVRSHLVRSRLATRAEIELEEHDSYLLLGEGATAHDGIPNDDYGLPGIEVLDEEPPPGLAEIDAEELERMRIEARTPRFGREIDERVLPAEAGLVERAVSLTKGCYPGQEPIARLHYRGHVNRSLRLLRLESEELPEPGTEIRYGRKTAGRVTSAARADGAVVALAYVRVEVPADAELEVGRAAARSVH